MSPIVELRELRKSFGAIEVLKGVTFDVERGQVAAIIGQSGSGKSTALRCIDHLEKINGGELVVCGHALHTDKPDLKALRRDVGIVFQGYNLFPHLTVGQNIMMAPRLVHGKSRKEVAEIGREMIAKVGLTDKWDAYPEQLSGGQQQRVAIARSLAMQPKLMLFDEVTSALDPKLTGEVLRVMEKLALEGMTMILVTHEMQFARNVAHKVIYMRDGRVHEMGGPGILSAPSTPELADFIAEE
ncbi:amino acid ABC transporter ATP-binding protein [Falsirhodobacter sp. 1013]|uniref:amino acid ABC transporter ATP-binding protein n=1 Tax=Falsirhodobacter sp. 1013 TaxID=3417566 RepID=UPI003EBA112C